MPAEPEKEGGSKPPFKVVGLILAYAAGLLR